MAVKFVSQEETSGADRAAIHLRRNLDHLDQPEFEDVGLLGTTEATLVNGSCTF